MCPTLLSNLNCIIMAAPVAAAGAAFAPAIISAVGGIVSQALQNQSVGAANARTERIAKDNRQWMTDMWNLQNDYNSPANQRKRFEEAGINPYMALGQMDVGNASTIGNPDSPQMQPSDYTPLSTAFSTASGQLQQARLINAQADKTVNEASSIGIDNQTKLVRDLATLSKLRSEVIQNKKAVELIDSQIYRINYLLDSEKENLDSQSQRNWNDAEYIKENQRIAYWNAKLAEYNYKNIAPLTVKRMIREIDQVTSQIYVNYTQGHLNEENAKLAVEKAATEICNRVIAREGNKRAWVELYNDVTNDIYDRFDEATKIKIFGYETKNPMGDKTKFDYLKGKTNYLDPYFNKK